MTNSNDPKQSQATAPQAENKSVSGIENLRPQPQHQSPTTSSPAPANPSTPAPQGVQGEASKGTSK